MLFTRESDALYKPATRLTASPSGLLHLGASTLYAGLLGTVRWHAHAVPVLLVALGSGFRLRTGSTTAWIHCRAAVVPAGLVHELETGDEPVAVWYPTPSAANPHSLTRLLSNAQFVAGCMVGHASETALFRELFERGDSHHHAGEVLDDLLKTRIRQPPLAVIDPRLLAVLDQIEAAPQHAGSATEWAAACGMSSSRFMHLFSEQLGVPYRRYRTWRRLRNSMRLASEGLSLTEAALESGFSDSQHFSREFSQKIGIAPSAILRRVGRVGFATTTQP